MALINPFVAPEVAKTFKKIEEDKKAAAKEKTTKAATLAATAAVGGGAAGAGLAGAMGAVGAGISMKDYNKLEIYSGLVSSNEAVINFILLNIYQDIRRNISLWFKGDLIDKITRAYISSRLKSFRNYLIRNNKLPNEISISEILAYCKKDFYDNLFQMEIVFNHLKRAGESFAWKRLKPTRLRN